MIKKEKTIMLQQVMTKPGEIIFREVPVPEVKDDQVLVKIMNIGFCGSDFHVFQSPFLICSLLIRLRRRNPFKSLKIFS